MQTTKLILLLFVVLTKLQAQNTKLDTRLTNGELKMNFPSVYFKHNSINYAEMPYTVDSCFKYIAANIKHLNSYSVWRDSMETDQLTNSRIKKLRTDLNKYTSSNKIHFHNMGKAQKISRHTMNTSVDKIQVEYLMSLNSLLDVSGAINKHIKKRKGHLDRPVWYCPNCWKRASQGYYKNKRRLEGK